MIWSQLKLLISFLNIITSIEVGHSSKSIQTENNSQILSVALAKPNVTAS